MSFWDSVDARERRKHEIDRAHRENLFQQKEEDKKRYVQKTPLVYCLYFFRDLNTNYSFK